MNFLKKYRLLIMTSVFSIIATSFGIYIQYLKGDIINFAVKGNIKTQRYILYFFTSILLEVIFTYLYSTYEKKYSLNRSKSLKKGIINKYLAKEDKLTGEKKSKILTMLTKQIDQVKTYFYQDISILIHLLLKAILITIFIFKSNKIFTVIVIVMLLNQIFLPKFFSKKLNKVNEKYQKKLEEFTEVIDEIFSNYSLIFSFFTQKQVKKRLYEKIDSSINGEYEKFKFNNILRMVNMLNSYLTHFFAVSFSGYLLYKKQINIGEFFIILGLVEQLTYPLIGISYSYQNIIGNKSLIEKLKKECEILEDDRDHFQEIKNGIQVKNISFSFGENKIINNLNLNFKKGRKYLIRGESGSGKSVLLNLFHQNYDLLEGEITVDEKNYKNFNIKKSIGFMKDKPLFFNITLRENILFNSQTDNKTLKKLMLSLGLDHLIERLDENLSYLKTNLSLGETKRIELLRLIVHDFPILLLDEPTSNLDEYNKKLIYQTIDKFHEKTIICTSHNFDIDFENLFDEVIIYGK